MPAVYKFLGTEVLLTANSSVANSNLVRVYASSSGVLTQYSNTGSFIANTTLATGEVVIVEKTTTDILNGSGMRATPIAYRN